MLRGQCSEAKEGGRMKFLVKRERWYISSILNYIFRMKMSPSQKTSFQVNSENRKNSQVIL